MGTPNIGAELQALPLGFLLGAPLKAAIEGQALAAQTTADFITNTTLTGGNGGDPHAVMIEFTYKQAIPDPTDPSTVIDKDLTLRVPLLAITQVPYLRINDLTVSFEFKIRDVQSISSQLKTTAATGTQVSSSLKTKTSAGGGILNFLGFPGGSAEFQNNFKLTFNASVTYQRSERQDTDRSATFKMNMNAVQDPIPEGMRRVLEILADTIRATTVPPAAPPPPPGPPPPP
jgi:Protein of unknown function (DUF2589)